MTTSPLAQPIDLGPVPLRNRTMHLAVNTGLLEDHRVTDAAFRYWRRRATGGVGAVVSGLVPVHPTSVYKHSVLKNTDDEDLASLTAFASAVAGGGATPIVQLVHNGGQVPPGQGPHPWSPSGHPVPGLNTNTARMRSQDIHELLRAYGAAAARAERAGIPVMEVHAAHGFLLHQFLSPLTNRRTDQYGGTEGGLLLLYDVLSHVRESLAGRSAVGLRLSAGDHTPGGFTKEAALRVASELSASGLVDYLSLSCGNYATLDCAITPYPGWPAPLLEQGRQFRASVTVPIVLGNGLATRELAQEAITSGATDIVGVGRPMIADPDWPAKVITGAPDNPPRPCIGCNECFAGGGVTTSDAIRCTVNPRLGVERFRVARHGQAGRERRNALRLGRTLVVGGGVAGLAAALELTDAGRDVTLIESGPRLGGQVLRYDSQVTKGVIGRYITYASTVLDRRGTPIRLGYRVRPVDLRRWLEDPLATVVLATGSRPVERPNRESDLSTWDVFDGAPSHGTLLVDAQEDDTAEALHVAHVAASRGVNVCLLTATDGPGQNVETLLRRALLDRLPKNVRILRGWSRVTAADGAVLTRDAEGRHHRFDPTTLVVTSPDRAPTTLALPETTVDGAQDRVLAVGDCVRPGSISAAIADAAAAADQILGRTQMDSTTNS